MAHQLQDVDLAAHAFDVRDLRDFAFLQDFYGDVLVCELVLREFYFAEGALAQGFL